MAKNYDGLLHEQILKESQAIRELVKDVPEMNRRVSKIEDKVDQLSVDVPIIKTAVIGHSGDIKKLKQHIGLIKN